MKIFNNTSIIDMVDNTRKGTIDETYLKGYSELHRLVHPNRGVIRESSDFEPDTQVIFFEWGLKRLPDGKLILDNDCIIIAGKELLKEGCIVTKETIPTALQGLKIRKGLEYFKVCLQKDLEIKLGTFVIISQKQCHRFNIDTLELFYIWPSAIVLQIDGEGINPGPEYIFVGYPDLGPVTKNDNMFGLDETGAEVYYSDYEFELRVENKPVRIIKKEDILVIKDK